MKKRYKGIYNVTGELHTLYCWAFSKGQAHLLLKKQLERKFGQKLWFKSISYQIKEEV